MSKLFNASALKRIEKAYPTAAGAAVSLIQEANNHNVGSAEVVMRYDQPGDKALGAYEVLVILRVQLREDEVR